MLDFQTFSISFNSGIDTKSDPKQVVGKLLSLENAVLTSIGQIKKRFGYGVLTTTVKYPTAGTLLNGLYINTLQSGLVFGDGTSLYSLSEDSNGWINVGQKKSSFIQSTAVASNADKDSAPKMALSSANLGFIAWTRVLDPVTTPSQVGNVYFSYYDTNSQESVVNGQLRSSIAYNHSTPFYSTDGNFYIIADGSVSTSSRVMYAMRFSSSPSSAPTSTFKLLDLYANSVGPVTAKFSKVAQLYDGTFAILYLDTSNNLMLARYSNSFSFISSISIGITNPDAIMLKEGPAAAPIIIAYAVPGTTTTKVYSIALAQISSNVQTPLTFTTLDLAGVVDPNGIDFFVFTTTSGTSPVPAIPSISTFYLKIRMATGAGLVSGGDVRSLRFYADPFVDSVGAITLPMVYGGTTQPTYFFVTDLFTNQYGHVSAKFAPGVSGDYTGSFGRVVSYGGKFLMPYLTQLTTAASASIAYIGTHLVKLISYDGAKQITSRELVNTLAIGGGVLSSFDTSAVVENGFFLYPELIIEQTAGTGISAGTYSFVAIYEWSDSQGNLYRSAPSRPVTSVVTTTINLFKISATPPGPMASGKQTSQRISVFRTEANGTVYYRVATQYQNNNATFIGDATLDTALPSKPQLYTTGGEVENIAPPATNLMTLYKNRLIIVDSENPYTWWYSKQMVTNFPAEFSDIFTETVDQAGGPITAIATLDDKLVLFKKSRIFYVVGDGPAPTGANNDFSYPQVITTDVGCMNQRSLATLPTGIMFQSGKGIYLLDRSLQTSYIGAAVEGFNNLTITSAQLTPETTQVRFTTDSDTILVFDYFSNQWSTFTGLDAKDSTIYENAYTILRNDSLIYQEDKTSYLDNGALYAVKAVTSWLKLSSLQNFQRVRKVSILGTGNPLTALNLTFNHDYVTTPTQTVSIPMADAVIPLTYEVGIIRQKSTALQITLLENPNVASGEFNLASLAFEAGMKRGLTKQPATRKFG